MPAGTIALILNFTFVLSLIIGFLIGLWRGVKKASINIVFSLVGLIIAFFISGVITNAILDIKIQNADGQLVTLAQQFVSMLQQDATLGQILGANANNVIFLEKLVYALANVMIFLLLALAVQFVCYIFYAILSAIVVKKKDKEGNKLPKHRVSGGIIGVVKTFVVMFFIFMPFNALLGTANDIVSVAYSTSATQAEGGETSKDQATQVTTNVLEGLNTSAYGIIGNMFGLDNVMCDYLTAFKLDQETIYIRQEVANIIDVYNVFTQISSPSEKTVPSKIDFNKLDKTLNNIVNSGIYKKVLIDTVGNIIENYSSYTFIDWNSLGEAQDIIKDLSLALKNKEGSYSDYFTNDIIKVYEAFKTIAQSGALDDSAELSVIQRVNVLANEHYQALESAVKNIFGMNLIKDSTNSALNLALSKLMEGVDKISVNGREITPEQWENMAVEISQVVKNFANLSVEVDVSKLLNDPLVILSSDSAIDIANTFDKLGKVIDGIRALDLLKNQEGVCVLDSLLAKNGFALPNEGEVIYNNDGSVATITNYTELMNFISPSLVELKNINIYDNLSSESVSVKEVMKTFANAVKNDTSTEKDVLSRIILPLSQVEPTKTLLVENLLKGLNNDLINFNSLDSYQAWKGNLKYISNLLVSLDKGSVGDNQTYLEYILLNNSVEDLFKNISASDATEILRPVLYADATASLKTQFFTTLTETFKTLLHDDTVLLSADNVTLKENDSNNQAEEICNVFEKLMAFYPTLTSETDLSSLDKVALGQLLDSMKINAYREGEAGIFAEVFENLADKVSILYPEIRKDPVNKYKDVNFTEILSTDARA